MDLTATPARSLICPARVDSGGAKHPDFLWRNAANTSPKTEKLNRNEAPPPMTLGDAAIDYFTERWYVAQVRGGTEKDFAWKLSDRQLPYFLPYETLKVIHGFSRRRIIHRPLFSGYVFINGGSNECYCAREQGAYNVMQDAQVLSAAMQAQLRRELNDLHRCLKINPVMSKPLGVGVEVEIARGPLIGLRGRVVNHAKGTQLILKVTMLGREVPVEIPQEFVDIF